MCYSRLGGALLLVATVFSCAIGVHAQETVFNVPSGDVLEHGKIYGEVDFAYRHSDGSASIAPRAVVGAGRGIEAGLNINGLGFPGDPQTIISPTLKWRVYDRGSCGCSFLIGDSIFIPVQNRAYGVGNYEYAEFVKWFRTRTRVTFGAYHFTPQVVSSGQRAGGQFAIEQATYKGLTLAVDWYTGNSAYGYVTGGTILKVTKKLTWYGSYQFGNRNASRGNQQFLTELGWNFN